MEHKWNVAYWIVTLVVVACVQATAEPFAVGPYLGQTPPGSTAQVFAPGLICYTGPHWWESHGHFSADGNTFCFTRRKYVYITENTDQGWTTPERVGSIPYKTWSPCLSPDANSIFFMRYGDDPSKRFLLHRCMRTPQGWSSPQELGSPFNLAVGGFSVAADNSIYFTPERGRFWVAPFGSDPQSPAVEIPVEKGRLYGCHPGIAPDESFMVFYSVRPGARGGTETDLYLTLRRPDGAWTKPRNMGPRINSGYYEFGARISQDKKYMFFTRGTGWSSEFAADIYWVELKEYLHDPNDPEANRSDLGIGTLAGSGGLCAEQRSLVHDARKRTYYIHLPVDHDKSKPTALVFCLHWYGGTGREIEKSTGLSLLADREGFIAVYPNALASGPKRKQTWNGGGAYENRTRSVDDVGFISALIDKLSREYTIDPARIYVFGHSNGGSMAHHLGARLPHKFAAIACSAGLLARNDFVVGPPVSVVHFHGKRDQIVPYTDMAKRDWAGVEKGISLWVKRNRCSSKAEILRQDSRIRVRKWAGPNQSGDVVLYELKTWGHDLAKTDKGAPITAVEEAWKFFKSHPKKETAQRSSDSNKP